MPPRSRHFVSAVQRSFELFDELEALESQKKLTNATKKGVFVKRNPPQNSASWLFARPCLPQLEPSRRLSPETLS